MESFKVDGLNSILSGDCIAKALKAQHKTPAQQELAKRAIISALLPVVDPTWLAATIAGSVEVWVRGPDFKPVPWTSVRTGADMLWQPSDKCIELLHALDLDTTYFAATATIRGPPPAAFSHLRYAKQVASNITPLTPFQQEEMLVGLRHTQPMCSTRTFAAHGAVMVGCGMPTSLKGDGTRLQASGQADPGAAATDTSDPLVDAILSGLCQERLTGYHQKLASCFHSVGLAQQALAAGQTALSLPTMAVASGIDLLALIKLVAPEFDGGKYFEVLPRVLRAADSAGLHMAVVRDPVPIRERRYTLGGNILHHEGRAYLVCAETREALTYKMQQLPVDLATVVQRYTCSEASRQAGLIAEYVGASESGICGWNTVTSDCSTCLFDPRLTMTTADPHGDPILSEALKVHGLQVFWIPHLPTSGGHPDAGRYHQVVAQASQVDAVLETICKQLQNRYKDHDRVGSLVDKVCDLLAKSSTRYAEAGCVFEKAAQELGLKLEDILQSTWRAFNIRSRESATDPIYVGLLLFPAFLSKHKHLVDEIIALQQPGIGWPAFSSLPDRLQQFMSVRGPSWTAGTTGLSPVSLYKDHRGQLSLNSSLQLPFGVVAVTNNKLRKLPRTTFCLVLDANAEAALRDAVGHNAADKENLLQAEGPSGVELHPAKRQRTRPRHLQ